MRRKISISFDGKTYYVTPNFAVVERIEQRFDFMSFLRSIQTYKAKTKDIAWVLYSAITESGYDEKYSDIGECVLSDLEGASGAAAEIVVEALGAGPEKRSKKKSAETSSTQESESTTE